MKKTILSSALLAVLVCVSGGAQASLVGRDINGNAVAGNDVSSVFLYDTVLNVTWLRNANVSGLMNWTQANTWAANLVVGAYDNWRLPTMIDSPNATFSYAGGTDSGYNVRTKDGIATQYQTGQTVYSEMAHLFYSTLSNKSYCPPGNASCSGAGTPQPGWGLTNSGDFKNLQSFDYWSGRESATNSSDVWVFATSDGTQDLTSKTGVLYALAVRSGDVAPSAVPVPAAAWLMASGLGALGVAARKRRAKAA